MTNGAVIGGAGDTVALDLGGRSLSYRDLRERVKSAPLGEGLVGAASDDPAEVLVAVLAAAAADRPVAVWQPGIPAPTLDALPRGAELVVVSSGSTGNPRPIARTRASWYDSFAAFGELCGTQPGSRVALTAPLWVGAQLFAALEAIERGATICDDIANADIVHLTPTRLSRVLAGERMPGTAVVAGAELPSPLAEAASRRRIRLVQYYGAAELSIVAASPTVEAELRAFPGVEIEIRAGELWARSPYLALPGPPDVLRSGDDGFATVGDLAEIAEDGSVRVRGRGSAAITVAGVTVIAEDLERALGSLPGVRAAAVFGVPHPLLGAEIAAVIEPAGLDLAALRAAANVVLAAAERPRQWFSVDSLPRTSGGKLARGVIAAAFASETGQQS